VRSYIPEKKQKGRRNWAGKAEEQQAVYANRRRVRGEYGKSLLRRRGELVERSFAHCYETGAMRRCHLRGQENIWKRQLIHVGAFNLSLILRQLLGAGTPREWKNRFGRLVLTLYLLFTCRMNQKRFCRSRISASVAKCFVRSRSRLRRPTCRKSATCTPGCYGDRVRSNNDDHRARVARTDHRRHQENRISSDQTVPAMNEASKRPMKSNLHIC